MRFRTALIIAVLGAASAALAQSPAPAAGTAAKPAGSGSPADSQAESSAKPAAPGAAAEKVDPAKDAAIRHLLEITEESKMGERMGNWVTGQVRQGMSRTLPPDRLQKFMETFAQKYNAAAPASAVTDVQVTIYARHFSMDDIKTLVQFYESPIGQRVVKAMPQISRETDAASREIDQQAALTVLREMSDEYTELKRILPPEPGKQPETTPASPGAPAATPNPAPAPAPAPNGAPPKSDPAPTPREK
ncbi:MAG TPA: DUF2059 domain-containing protein [Candidatus Sulfotelmatobacter sp.]|nr:DUF2059 domain-containing protein [Candidatus Sulfotelmatobacter sp.]